MEWFEADRIVKANPGLTADDIRGMTMADWARLTGQPLSLLGQSPQPTHTETPATPENASESLSEPQTGNPEPVSVKSMTLAEYGAFRATIGMGQSQKEGKGIFDGVSSKSDAYKAAAAKQAGRTGWIGSNVEESPRIARPNLVNVDRPNLDARPLSERFGTR